MNISEIRRTIHQSQAARWKYLRRLGRARFVLFYGVIRTGLALFLLFAFVMPTQATFSFRALVAACIFFPGGALIGWLEWGRFEERYGDGALDDGDAQGLTNR